MHVIVISYDAFSEGNWELAQSLPNLEKLLQNGAYSTKLKSVYPTLTYTVHTTMVTGVYPDKHGIFHNNPFQPFIPEKDQEWFWFRDAIKVPTIYDAVKEHNLTAAGLLWPVSGKSSLKYNMPEVHAVRGENQAVKVLKNGSPFFCIGMELRHGRCRRGVEQPYLDDFTTRCAVDTIRRKTPNLLLVHLIELDDAKHRYGTDSKEVREAIIRMDGRLGGIRRAVEEAGIEDNTVMMVIGDHGQLDVRYKVRLNRLLLEQGLISEEGGKMQWRAYLQSAGGGAYLHIKEGDQEAEALALAVLEKALKAEQYGIEKILVRNELEDLHVEPSITTMVEARRGYCFDDRLEAPVLLDLEAMNKKYATHGYLPDREGYRCNFIASGPGIKKNHPLGPLEMVDIAPTLGAMLGVDFTHGDGRVLREIFS